MQGLELIAHPFHGKVALQILDIAQMLYPAILGVSKVFFGASWGAIAHISDNEEP